MDASITAPDGLLPQFEELFRQLYAEVYVLQDTICKSDLMALEMATHAAQNHYINRHAQAQAVGAGDMRQALAYGTAAQAESRACRAALASIRLIGVDRSLKSKTKLRKAGVPNDAPGGRWEGLLPSEATQ